MNHMRSTKRWGCTILLPLLGWLSSAACGATSDLDTFDWTVQTSSAAWEPRAGLQAAQLGETIYILGGRTPTDPQINPVPGASTIWGDVWKSEDWGRNWTRILESETPGHWAPRAYFEAITKDEKVFVLGGQDFSVIEVPGPGGPMQVPVSNFFNDVWSSSDGIQWTQMTPDAPWEGRAGLSSAVLNGEIFVLGGSKNDDSSIVGPGGPARIYFDDVWKSSDDGASWQLVQEHAPWEPRAGGAVVVKDDFLYLLGGEEGFLCEPFPGCSLPYFNDVWRTSDGENWELVTASADWSPRPGHKAAVIDDQIVLFGGFGLPTNPIDVWVSGDGASWQQLSGGPWNAVSPDEIKYDFDVLGVEDAPEVNGPAIYSFGGDRETFNFADPTNFLRVDNDVWRFSAPIPEPSTGALLLFCLSITVALRSRGHRSNSIDGSEKGA